MDIIVSAGSSTSIPPHPEGQFAATCIDIIDLGMVETTYPGVTKKKHRVVIRFFCGETFDGSDGPAPLWVSTTLTASLHEHATMRKFLEAWRGKKFTPDELKGFNLTQLLGVPAFLQISHRATPTRTYANIETIMKLPRGMDAPGVPADYVRAKDRADDHAADEGEDDGLPF